VSGITNAFNVHKETRLLIFQSFEFFSFLLSHILLSLFIHSLQLWQCEDEC